MRSRESGELSRPPIETTQGEMLREIASVAGHDEATFAIPAGAREGWVSQQELEDAAGVTRSTRLSEVHVSAGDTVFKLNTIDDTFHTPSPIERIPNLDTAQRVETARTLVLNNLVAPEAGDFARSKIRETFVIPDGRLEESGINFSNFSASQAERVVNAIREQYSHGEWERALQLAIATKSLGHLAVRAKEQAVLNELGTHTVVYDNGIESALHEEFGTDTRLLVIRALEMGIHTLRRDGRRMPANHCQEWLRNVYEGLELDQLTSPEITQADVLGNIPSPLNPEPSRWSGEGEIRVDSLHPPGAVHYSDGSVFYGKYRSPENSRLSEVYLRSDSVGNPDTEYSAELPEVADRVLLDNAMKHLMKQTATRKELYQTYEDILITSAQKRETLPQSARASDVATAVAIQEVLKIAETDPGKALAIYDYTTPLGPQEKMNLEARHNISLEDDERLRGLRSGIRESLLGLALLQFADEYKGHPELSDKIAQLRRRHQLEEEGETHKENLQSVANEALAHIAKNLLRL